MHRAIRHIPDLTICSEMDLLIDGDREFLIVTIAGRFLRFLEWPLRIWMPPLERAELRISESRHLRIYGS